METYTVQLSPGDDECQRQFTRMLTKEELQRFSQTSDSRFLTAFAIELSTIAFTIWLCESYWNLALYVLAVIVIGSRMHAFAVLMHEAAHYRALSNRKWNDVFGEAAALATPITMLGYRKNHFVHHRELNSDDDPDWQRTRHKDFEFPKTRAELARVLLMYALGINTLRDFKNLGKEKYVNDIPNSLKLFRLAFLFTLVGAGILFGFWKQVILYYFVPMFTSFMLFAYIRSLAEHYSNLKYEHVLNHSRTVLSPFWERWLFAPYNINYHLEHHLYPSVPFFRLPELHDFLMKKPPYQQSAHITHGYIKGLLLTECCTDYKTV